MKKKIIILFLALTIVGYAGDFYYEYGKKVEVTKLSKKRANSNVTYYKTSNGHNVGVNGEILVQCEEGIDCQSLLVAQKLEKVTRLTDKIFLVTIAKGENVFEWSQKLYENDKIKIAHPNFIKTKRRR